MTDIFSAFMGITTPANELYAQIEQYGWTPTKVAWDNKLNAYAAEAKNQSGEKIIKTGPDDKTALGNLLIAINRRNNTYTAAYHKLGMWKTMFTDQLEEIAKAYAAAPVYDQKAAAAFKELADDSVRRAEILKGQLNIEVVDNPEPYQNAQEMAEDVHKNRHFYVSRANCQHPVFTVEQNIAFRTVHDVMGHAITGGDFGWAGENLACAAHFPLLSANAQKALFTDCLGQVAYAVYYGTYGPQKVAFLDEFIEPAMKRENDPNHRPIHPSQSFAPTAMPEIEPSKANAEYGAPPEGTIPPHLENTGPLPGISTFSTTKLAGSLADPNAFWQSGVDPFDPETHGVGNAYLHHGDPLEAQAVMDNAGLIDTGWHEFVKGNGAPDTQRMKQAIVNAFRVALLSPRKDLRWNAVHYQDISHIPAETDDPKVYWDTLEAARQHWNAEQVRKMYEGKVSDKTLKEMMAKAAVEHQSWRKQIPNLFGIIYAQSKYNYKLAQKRMDRMIYHWLAQEEDRILTEEATKPVSKRASGDEVSRKAHKTLEERIKKYIADSQTSLDVQAAAKKRVADPDQPTLETGDEAVEIPTVDKYGAFMGAHMKAIAKISQHSDELLDAALEDVHGHDGSGHHFRAKALGLGISGVGPKVCSFAWLLLQPMTSQLATIDTHMLDVLGHTEKDMSNRDYFKFERELAAGRDAAGYGHIPLGAFQWGMWDLKRTGPGSHQDHSAMKVVDPLPHGAIDWQSKAPLLKGEAWTKAAPDWWKNTQSIRKEVAKNFDETVAPGVKKNQIPFVQTNEPESTVRSARKIAEKEFSKGFKHWWDNHKPLSLGDAKLMADYARGTKTSKEKALKFIEDHKSDVKGDFEKFKKKFLKRFDDLQFNSHRMSFEAPEETNMARLIREHGLSTPEIWKMYPELTKQESSSEPIEA